MRLWTMLYNILAIPILYLAIHLMALNDVKIRIGIRRRRGLFRKLSHSLESINHSGPRFWIHNSSMGEFEQTKPLIHALKTAMPDCVVVVSFFSPSGMEYVGNDQEADCLCYLPFDTYMNARRFVRLVRPDAAFVIRHEFWPNHLMRLRREGIPCFLVNSSVRHAKTFRYPLVLASQRYLFGFFTKILTVSLETKRTLEQYGLTRAEVSVIGDTRYDQVVARSRQAADVVKPLHAFRGDRHCLVAGSSWPSDERVIFTALDMLKATGLLPKVVLVPHEPNEEHLRNAEDLAVSVGLSACRFAEYEKEPDPFCDVLIIDRIGILAGLYAIGDIAFVGGGFGAGVHQVLEPAALGKVVFYGPRCKNSYEAMRLQRRGMGFVVENGDQLFAQLYDFLKDPKKMAALGQKAATLVEENVGAAERIVGEVQKTIPGLGLKKNQDAMFRDGAGNMENGN